MSVTASKEKHLNEVGGNPEKGDTMKRIASIIIALAMIISTTSFANAGNDKTKAGFGINPTGISGKPGFDNGNAWWKKNNDQHRKCKKCDNKKSKINICEETNILLQSEIDSLKEQIIQLQAELEAAQDQIIQQEILMASRQVDEAFDAEVAAESYPLKFAIAKRNDGNYSIYTNNWPLDNESKDKLNLMKPGKFNVQVRITNIETGIEVLIQSSPEAYDWIKTGYEWFIGQTITG